MINLLDCTIRDGSYATHYQWEPSTLQNIVGGLSSLGIQYIEIGNGTGLGAYRSIDGALTDLKYFENCIPYKGDSLVGVFFIPDIGTKDDIKEFKEAGGDFIRIGTNPTDINKAVEYIRYARSLGLMVCSNLMKTYAISVYQLVVKAQILIEAGADCIYVVDSAGGMLPDRVGDYVETLCNLYNVKVGFHGHNNLMMANANSLSAAQHGASFVDASLMSLGRGAGNAQTESLVALLQKAKLMPDEIDVLKLSELGQNVVFNLLSSHSAMNKQDIVAATSFFHDSYLPAIKKYAKKYHVNEEELIQSVSKINIINPSEELFEISARRLAEGIGSVKFPKFFHKCY